MSKAPHLPPAPAFSGDDDVVPEAASSASPPDPPPSREEIDYLRNTRQFTPSEVNTYIDQRRPSWRAAGFSHQEIDGYYGVERFDWNDAVQQLLDASGKAEDVNFDPKLLTDDIRENFYDPQVGRQPDNSGFGWDRLATQAQHALANIAINLTGLEGPIAVARAVARRKLLECQRAGSCGDPNSFRNGMLDTLANMPNTLPKDMDNSISDAVNDVMTDPWTRVWLHSHPAMQILSRMPRKTASALLWSLYDKTMPGDREAYEAGFLAWWKVREASQPAAGSGDTSGGNLEPDWESLGNAVRNFQDVHPAYGVSPSDLILQNLDNVPFLNQMLSPDAIRNNMDTFDHIDTVGDNEKYRTISRAINLGAAAAAMSGAIMGPGDGEDTPDVEDAPGDDDSSTGPHDTPSETETGSSGEDIPADTNGQDGSDNAASSDQASTPSADDASAEQFMSAGQAGEKTGQDSSVDNSPGAEESASCNSNEKANGSDNGAESEASAGEGTDGVADAEQITQPHGAVPFAKKDWGLNRLVKESRARGFILRGESKNSGGLILSNPKTGEEIRIMPRPDRPRFRTETPAKFENSWYYRYRPGRYQEEGPHQTIPDKGGKQQR